MGIPKSMTIMHITPLQWITGFCDVHKCTSPRYSHLPYSIRCT